MGQNLDNPGVKRNKNGQSRRRGQLPAGQANEIHTQGVEVGQGREKEEAWIDSESGLVWEMGLWVLEMAYCYND